MVCIRRNYRRYKILLIVGFFLPAVYTDANILSDIGEGLKKTAKAYQNIDKSINKSIDKFEVATEKKIAKLGKTPFVQAVDKEILRTVRALPFVKDVEDIVNGHPFQRYQEIGLLIGHGVSEGDFTKVARGLKKMGEIAIPFTAVMDSLKSAAEAPFKLEIVSLSEAVKLNPYKRTKAHVRVSQSISAEEEQFIRKRRTKTRKALERFLGMSSTDSLFKSDDDVPSIALVCSGGGYRAMLCTLGALCGAEDIGLLDTVMWLVGLSGSTWVNARWMSTQKNVRLVANDLYKVITKGLESLTRSEFETMVDTLLLAWALEEPITIVDIYGYLLANRLFNDFGNRKNMLYLSDQVHMIKNADRPFPLYAAINPIMHNGNPSAIWLEFNPYEIGSAGLHCFIPSWAYGRTFSNGASTNYDPEQPLGAHLGTFGSAFCASLYNVYEHLSADIKFSDKIKEALVGSLLKVVGNLRISWKEVFNFSKNVRQSPLFGEDSLRLVDAGLAINLPYPLIGGETKGRKADIIIFIDASHHLDGAPGSMFDFKKVEVYAREHGLSYPKIDYSKVSSQAVSVFSDPGTPLVIYMPRVIDQALINRYKHVPLFHSYIEELANFDLQSCVEKGFCQTANFKYSPQESKQLAMVMEFNMKAGQEVIKNAIETYIKNRKK
ncbi:MAG: hypothetical protein WBQ73_03360 [Candidatus Babeliales bacterium]